LSGIFAVAVGVFVSEQQRFFEDWWNSIRAGGCDLLHTHTRCCL